MTNISSINIEYANIKKTLEELIHGTIQIRTTENKKYIYVYLRENGILHSKYVGEYSDELYNLILNNNKKAKELKNRLKILSKELEDYHINEAELTDLVKLNIDLARKYLVDSIYKQSILEGVATTYSDTETLVNEGKVKDMSSIDVQKIINLKHAWEFIMDYDVETCPTNYSLLCQINALVEEGISSCAGRIRSVPVTIGGSTYIPPIPFEYEVKENLERIQSSNKTELEKAAELIAYTMKTQTFLDGNKRTAIIFGNHYLISHGLGLIVVPVDKISTYKRLLLEYYENKSCELLDFLIRECYIPIR